VCLCFCVSVRLCLYLCLCVCVCLSASTFLSVVPCLVQYAMSSLFSVFMWEQSSAHGIATETRRVRNATFLQTNDRNKKLSQPNEKSSAPGVAAEKGHLSDDST